MRLDRSRRGAAGPKRLDLSEFRAALKDSRIWCGLGVVVLPDGETSHYDIDADYGPLVHVELMPNQEPILCRLGGLGSGNDSGVWRIPPVGSEVAVMVPHGDLASDCMIVAVLSSGDAPSELDGDTLVVKAPKVKVISTGGDVTVQASGTVYLRQGSASTQGVCLGADMKSAFDSHVHADPATGYTGTPCTAVGVPVTAPAASSTVKVSS